MEFAIRIKELRESKNLTQAELANLIGVGVSTIGMWESTKRIPSAKTLNKLLDYFNCSLDYLLGNENQSKAKTIEIYSEEERKLIEDYRALSPALKKMLQDTIQTWQRSEANKKTQSLK